MKDELDKMFEKIEQSDISKTLDPTEVSTLVGQNGYLALIRQCLELERYMLPAALEYPSGD